MAKRINIGEKILGISILMWIASLVTGVITCFMPNRYHYECIGSVTEMKEGEFVVNHPETQSAEKFDRMLVYVPVGETGKTDTLYMSEPHDPIEINIKEYHEDNAWKYVYRYKTWTCCLIYFGILFIMTIILSNLDPDWAIEVEDKKKSRVRLKRDETNNSTKIW